MARVADKTPRPVQFVGKAADGARRWLRQGMGSRRGRVMPQFSGHWYSGRAARLCAIEGGLVSLALWTTGRHASSGRGLTALIAAAGRVPAALCPPQPYSPP